MKKQVVSIYFRTVALSLLIMLTQPGIAQQPDDYASSGLGSSQPTDPNQKLELLLTFSSRETNAKESLMYAEQAIGLADSLQNQPLKAKALQQSGVAWKIWGDNFKSTERLNQALDIYSSLGLLREIAQVQRDIGETYRAARGFNFSVEALQKALAYFESVNDSVEMAKTYNRLAATRFEKIFNFPDFRYLDTLITFRNYTFDSALQLFPVIKAERDSFLICIEKASRLSSELNLPDLIISNDIISAAFTALEKDYEKSQKKYDEIIAEMYLLDDLRDFPLVLINKARTYGWTLMNQPEKAIPLAHQALELAQQNSIKPYQYLASEILHENYRELGNYEQAYLYANNLQNLFKQFHNDDLALTLKTQGFEFQIKEREMELKYKRMQLTILIVAGIMIIGIFSLFSVLLMRKNRRLHKLLIEVNQKTRIITEQNNQLAQANAEKDKFFSIIAHDLRTPFNAFLGFSELMADESFDVSIEEMRSYAKDIRKSAYLLFELLENLLEWSRLQRNMIQMELLEYPLLRLVHQGVDALHENAEKKQITVEILLDHNLKVFADEKMIQSVFRNLISNGIKFTHMGGRITISAKTIENGFVEIKVQDTGLGISENDLPRLFRIDESLNAKGTDGEPSTGLGLILCKEFVEKHGGKIWAESEAGIGSAFYFTLKAV